MSYNSQKAAQTVAFFAMQNGGSINVLKAIKLVYLVDRESIRLRGHPVQDEPRYSMPHGPVNSTTLDHINGAYRENQPAWQDILEARAGNSPVIGLSNREMAQDDLDQLSRRELSIMHDVWAEFGHMDRFDLADWTHDNLVEWQDPNGSSRRIPLDRMMAAVGLEKSIERAREYESLKQSQDLLASF